jgi:sugar O-acyltransferase (sialic acid O-acetyltransferase NeuD family)
MSDKVVLFGTGSSAEVVHFYLTHDSDHEVVAFTVHEDHRKQETLLGLPVVPFERLGERFPPGEFGMHVAVGYSKVNRTRAGIYQQAKEAGYELVSYVSSLCTRWGDTAIGDNCFILEDNTIQPFVTIGDDVVIWSGNHIGHHVTIEDHCFVSSHVVISGHVTVGAYSFLGVNATIRDNVTIAEENVVGAGALILASTKPRDVFPSQRTKAHRLKSDQINF